MGDWENAETLELVRHHVEPLLAAGLDIDILETGPSVVSELRRCLVMHDLLMEENRKGSVRFLGTGSAYRMAPSCLPSGTSPCIENTDATSGIRMS